MENTQNIALILAAGKGTRMKSDLPKVLHTIHGTPLLQFVLNTTRKIPGLTNIFIVIGHQAENIRKAFNDQPNLTFIEQLQQLGTGHAVMQAESYLQGLTGSVLILCGDTPLLSDKTLIRLLKHQQETKAAAVVLTADLDDPGHYGRIIRSHDDEVLAIREYRDCTEQEKNIKEINSGVFCFDIQELLATLKHLSTDNDQNEYYLTDTLEILNSQDKHIKAVKTADPNEIIGINSKAELDEVSLLLGKEQYS
ncbi:NTP transferase domain-containing protein [Candidatus Margulisiibacteriota bacterium]